MLESMHNVLDRRRQKITSFTDGSNVLDMEGKHLQGKDDIVIISFIVYGKLDMKGD